MKLRHQADKMLEKRALERFRSRHASLGEKAAALGVAGIMKAKVKLGMGLSSQPSGMKILSQCEKILQKLKKNLEDCLLKISELKKNDKKPVRRKRKNTKKKHQNLIENMIIDVAEQQQEQQQPTIEFQKAEKRKIEDGEENDIKKVKADNSRVKIIAKRRIPSINKRKFENEDDNDDKQLKRLKIV